MARRGVAFLHRTAPLAAAALIACATAPVAAMQALADGDLGEVHGADGVAFNLSGFSLSGPLTLTYTAPNGDSLSLENLALSRSDDPDATFSDPYTLKIVQRPGLADAIVLSEPANANGLLKWQFAADWHVDTSSTDLPRFDGGALVISDLVSKGGSVTLTTPAMPGVEGFAFGIALNLDVGALAFRARGRNDSSEQLQFSGIHLSAADSNGNLLGTPWALADATNQPGILNAITDADGNSYLHVGIDWPKNGAAPLAGLVIDNIAFNSASGNVDLGSSRIGTMQIQYVDIKLKPGP
jgi:hypothetical protein